MMHLLAYSAPPDRPCQQAVYLFSISGTGRRSNAAASSSGKKRCCFRMFRLHRIAEPECQFNRNVVNVKYTIIAIDQRNGHPTKWLKLHPMRYLFVPEIEMLASQHNFEVTETGGWLTGQT